MHDEIWGRDRRHREEIRLHVHNMLEPPNLFQYRVRQETVLSSHVHVAHRTART